MICTARWACGSCRVVHSWKRIRNDEVIFVSQIINRSRTCLSEGNGIILLSTWRGYLIYKQNIVLLILDKKEK